MRPNIKEICEKISVVIEKRDFITARDLLLSTDDLGMKHINFDDFCTLFKYASVKLKEFHEYMIDTYMDHVYDSSNETIWMILLMQGDLNDQELSEIVSKSRHINMKSNGINKNTILHRMIETITDRTGIEIFSNTINILLDNGSDPFIQDYVGRSSIDLCLYGNCPIELLLLLLNKVNEPVNISTVLRAIYLKSLKNNRYDVIELLLKYIDDINETNYDIGIGRTILSHAESHIPDETDVIDLLIENGAKTF